MKKIGITTTVPAEILIAAGYSVVDLNNSFTGSADPAGLISDAEKLGFPRNTCAWIKGIFSACMKNDIREIVGVVEGDCSNTRALLDVFQTAGVRAYPFAYPHDRKVETVRASMTVFMNLFGIAPEQAEAVRNRLLPVRSLAKKLDELTYLDNKATGFENHLYQISLSDFCSDENECKRMLKSKIEEIQKRSPIKDRLKLGYIGVPPMMPDLYDYLEKAGARVVYNEVQREFAFPRAEMANDIIEQYRDYTYPYDIDFRLCEIKKQITERKLDSIIHYVQAFCYRAIDDIVIKKSLDLPVLTIEGDRQNTEPFSIFRTGLSSRYQLKS